MNEKDAKSGRQLLDLPLPIRERIYGYLLQSTLSLVDLPKDHRLKSIKALTPASTLLKLHLTCHKTHKDLSDSTIIPWPYTTFLLAGEASRELLYYTPQAIRRLIRHLEVDYHTVIDYNKHSIAHCLRLQTLQVSIPAWDDILLNTCVAERKPRCAILRPLGRTLRVLFTVAKYRGDGKQRPACLEESREERQRDMRRNLAKAYPFSFLSQLVPTLPMGCRVLLIGHVSEEGRDVLFEAEGWKREKIGKDGEREKWIMTYLKDV